MTIAYCEVCAWSLEIGDGTTREDMNRAMIEHHVETGHAPIETTDAERPDPVGEPAELGPAERWRASKRPSTGRPDWLRER